MGAHRSSKLHTWSCGVGWSDEGIEKISLSFGYTVAEDANNHRSGRRKKSTRAIYLSGRQGMAAISRVQLVACDRPPGQADSKPNDAECPEMFPGHYRLEQYKASSYHLTNMGQQLQQHRAVGSDYIRIARKVVNIFQEK